MRDIADENTRGDNDDDGYNVVAASGIVIYQTFAKMGQPPKCPLPLKDFCTSMREEQWNNFCVQHETLLPWIFRRYNLFWFATPFYLAFLYGLMLVEGFLPHSMPAGKYCDWAWAVLWGIMAYLGAFIYLSSQTPNFAAMNQLLVKEWNKSNNNNNNDDLSS